MAFDYAGARAAGYSDAEIQEFVQQQQANAAPERIDPTEGMGTYDRAMAGVGSGMVDMGQGLRQLIAKIGPENIAKVAQHIPGVGPAFALALRSQPVTEFLDEKQVQADIDEKRALDKPLLDTTAGKWGNVGGRIAATLPLAMALPATGVAAGVGSGALMGALDPVATGESRSQNIITGAIGGGAGGAIMKGLAKMASPAASTSDDIQKLLAEGVDPTLGRLLGPTASRFEDAASSMPFTGDILRRGQARVNEELNTAAVNRVLKPLGQRLPGDVPAGFDAVNHAAEAVDTAFNSLLAKPGMKAYAGPQFVNRLAQIRADAANMLPADKAAQFDKMLDNYLLGRFQPGVQTAPNVRPHMEIVGDALKQAEADTGQVIRAFGGAKYGDDRIIGDSFKKVQEALRDAISRSNPQYATELKAANTAYANLKRVENAARRSDNGVFNPSQLKLGVRAEDTSARGRAGAHGQALMQDLAQAGQVLKSTEPNSGTPYRMMVEGLLLGGAGVINPALLAAIPAAMAAYSKAGRKGLSYLMARRPEIAVQIAEQMMRRGMPVAALAGSEYNLATQ